MRSSSSGAPRRLSVLVIDDGVARVEPAEELAGASCRDVNDRLRARLGADFRVAAIGAAGERLVKYATISHDGRHAGRGGAGAVLGSKHIKAIAVRGTQRCEWADPSATHGISRDLSQRSFGPATAKYRELGTATNLLTFNRFERCRPGTSSAGPSTSAEQLSPESLGMAHARTRESCVACTIGCEHIYALGEARRPRWSTRACSPSDRSAASVMRDAVLRALQRVRRTRPRHDQHRGDNRVRHGVRRARAGAMRPGCGSAAAMRVLRAIDLIGRREGIGDLLARGQPPRGRARSGRTRWLSRRT